jgi:hypothetical protein
MKRTNFALRFAEALENVGEKMKNANAENCKSFFLN